jgi:hypothetical protein
MSKVALGFGAGGALLCAGVAAMVAHAVSAEPPTARPGANSFEGVVAERNATVPSPVGEPLVFGYVELGARERSDRGYVTVPKHREFRGFREVALTTPAGERKADLTGLQDPFAQLAWFPLESVVLDTFEGHPEEPNVPDWRSWRAPGGYYANVVGLRRGDPVVIELDDAGALKTVWSGDLGGLADHADRTDAQGKGLFYGAVSLAVGLTALAAGLLRLALR